MSNLLLMFEGTLGQYEFGGKVVGWGGCGLKSLELVSMTYWTDLNCWKQQMQLGHIF